MEWLSKFDPLNNDYQMAVDMTFRDWHQLNLAGARAWLDSKGDERFGWLAPATATALRFQAYNWHQSHDLGADWTGSLDTALKLPERNGLKWGTAAVIVSFWLNRDAAAAEAWMKSAGMPEAFQVKARQRAENPRPDAGAPRAQARQRTRRALRSPRQAAPSRSSNERAASP